MKQINVNIPDTKLKFFFKLLKELGFVKISANHYELKEDLTKGSKKFSKSKTYTQTKMSSSNVSEPEFKYEITSEAPSMETSIVKRNNQKQSKIGKKERDLVTKRIKSAKKSDFIPLEKFEKQMRKKLGYKK